MSLLIPQYSYLINACILQFYFVTSHRSSQVMFMIDHDSHYSIYLSDETGIYFTLSLEDLVVDDSRRTIDLQIVSCINIVINVHIN